MSIFAPAKSGQIPESAEKFFVAAGPFLENLDRFFDVQRNEFEPELRELVDYALAHSGKRLRPIALFLTGGEESNPSLDSVVRAAAVVELVHLATLVHDDILDAADLRHDQETVARKYGISAAVLLGDALFAQSLQLASGFGTTEVCRLVSEATRKICAGEIEQSLDGSVGTDDIQRYFRIIERKTAVLFEVSCRLGALLGLPGPSMASTAGDFGRHLGIAYQIYDDLVDLVGSEKSIGKTLGTDFSSGKRTLPLILLSEALGGDLSSYAEKGGQELSEELFNRGIVGRVGEYFQCEIDKAKVAAEMLSREGGNFRLLELANFVERRFASLLEETVS